jgi:hypothetical protein
MYGFSMEEHFMTRSGRLELALTAMVSVCLVPYPGDQPPIEEQELAEAYSYPPHFIALPQS